MRFIGIEKRSLFLTTSLFVLIFFLVACHKEPQGPMDDQGNLIGQAQIQAVSVDVSGETPPYDIDVTVRGILPDACTNTGPATISRQDHQFQVELTTMRPAKERCKEEAQSFIKTISLDGVGLTAGDYAVIVNGIQGDFTLTQDNVPPTPTPTPTPLPPVLLPAIDPPTPTPMVTPESDSAQEQAEENNAPCTNRIKFVRDVTVPDNAKIAPNARFTKTWRLQNTGTCTWTEDYTLIFARGEQMNGPESQSLGDVVKPGQKVDVSVELIAPATKGAYTSEWMLQAPNGEQFGLGNDGKTPFWVKIRVPKNAPAGNAASAAIRGFVWHDLCASDQATADALPEGCELAPNGGVIADGVFQPGEPPIGGVEVTLGEGACPSSGLATVTAAANGVYQFKGLKPGEYCVSIDATSDFNHYILIPGQWTAPPEGRQTVILAPGETRSDVNFGWDYEMAP